MKAKTALLPRSACQDVLPPENPLIGSTVLFTGLHVLVALDRICDAAVTQIEANLLLRQCRDALATHFPGLGSAAERIQSDREPAGYLQCREPLTLPKKRGEQAPARRRKAIEQGLESFGNHARGGHYG